MSQYEGLEGGELAASLSPAVRMDMVSSGYNPMSPEDVNRYYNKQKPVEGLHEVAGVKKYTNLGGGVDATREDAGLLQQFEKEVGVPLVSSRVQTGNPRDDVRGMMNNYNSPVSDLDSKISRISEKVQMSKQRPPIQSKKLIQTPKQQQTLITEAAKAKRIGYTVGIKYINAFIDNIKAPSAANRASLIKEMNQLILIEDKVHPQLLKEYRLGIAIAENELYQKIKGKKS